MKLIVEELIDDVVKILDPINVEVVYEVEKKKEVISSGCTN